MANKKISKFMAGLLATSAIMPAMGVMSTSAMEQKLNVDVENSHVKHEILEDIAMNIKFYLMSEIITEMRKSSSNKVEDVCKMYLLGLRTYLSEKLESKEMFNDVLRGPVSGRWLSKYTLSSLYNLVRTNQGFILTFLKSNSTDLL